jgi:hypothetical protein
MALPFSLPPYIAKPKQSFANAIEIKCFGLGTELFGGIILDDRYCLEGGEASSSFYLIPTQPSDAIPYVTASFYSDCLAFEHALPTLAIPNRGFFSKFDIPWSFKPSSRKDLRDLYIEHLCESFEMAAETATGLWQHVVFKYDWLEVLKEEYKGYSVIKVPFLSLYKNLALPLHLYIMQPLGRAIHSLSFCIFTESSNIWKVRTEKSGLLMSCKRRASTIVNQFCWNQSHLSNAKLA